MMLVIGLLITWVLAVAAILVMWARLHAEARAAAGIDEEAYVNGLEQFPPSGRSIA